MAKVTRDMQLDYFEEYPLGAPSGSRQRRVPLREGQVKNHKERLKSGAFDQNVFAWKHAQRSEGREGIDDNEGIWPISFWRAEKCFGDPGNDIFPQEMELSSVDEEILFAAQEKRLLGYFRVRNSSRAIAR